MHASPASVNRAISQQTSSICPLEKNKFRVVSMFIVICALHGMAWHVVPCLTARQDTTSEWYPGRWVGGRCHEQSRGRDDVFLCLCSVDIGDWMRGCTQNSPMVVSSLDCLRDGKLLGCRND